MVCSLVLVRGMSGNLIALSLAGTVAFAGTPTWSTYAQEEHIRLSAAPSQQTTTDTTRVTVHFDTVPLRTVLEGIAKQAGLTLAYNASVIPNTRITLHAEKMPVRQAFQEALKGTGWVAQIRSSGDVFIIRDAAPAKDTAKTGSVTGTIRDAQTKQPIAEATIALDGTKIVVRSQNNGTFRIPDVSVGTYRVAVKRLGYETYSTELTVTASTASPLTVLLTPATTHLSEVVTTAAGQQSRLTIGNSVTSLNVDSLIKAVPVRNLTDILDAGRVPGLIVSRGNGAPGAPARIRIRGIGTLNATSDPILIVDGVRSYSNQTTDDASAQYSVLDRIDIESVKTIEVFNGPSASALYGSDAANGVIVITTKRGTAGPTRWQIKTDQQWTTQPGSSPLLYYREGSGLGGGKPGGCIITVVCTNDTLWTYNYLDDPRTTVFGTGNRQQYSVSADGGSNVLRYFLSGRSSRELGLLKMSNADVAYIEQTTGVPVPGWQRRPLANTQVGGTGGIDLQLTPTLNFKLTSGLTRSLREETPLKSALGVLERASPADSSLVTGSISRFRQQTRYRELASRNTINGVWTPKVWLNMEADAGYDMLGRRSNELLRRGDCVVFSAAFASATCDAGGFAQSVTDSRTVGSANIRLTTRPAPWKGIRLTPTAGANYVRESLNIVDVNAEGLSLGGTSAVGAAEIDVLEQTSEPVSFGLFLSSTVSLFHDRIFTSLGTRIDASNALGADVRPVYPKLDLSYPVSQERWFPWRSTTMRVRLAYGHSAVQPGIGSTNQTYTAGTGVENGVVIPSLSLSTLGNIELRPERSTEFEGGFDLGILDDRLTLSLTHYRKLTRDMLTTREVPPSLGGIGRQTVNLGSVKNSGIEFTFDGILRESDWWRWSLNGTLSRNRNILVQLADRAANNLAGPFYSQNIFQNRLVEGYPLNGKWMRPVITYADLDGDGILANNEILRSDSSIFVGGPEPNYQVALNTQLGLWRNRVTIALNTQYTDGMAQANRNGIAGSFIEPGVSNGNAGINGALTRGRGGFRAMYDPSTSLEEQAATRSGYAFVSVVSVLKVTSLSIRFIGPETLTRKMRARAMTIAIQGSNLGTWTNYSGRDPNVNDSIIGNLTGDSGNLPMPRTWGLNVSLSY